MDQPVCDALKEVSSVLRKLEHYLNAVAQKNADDVQSEEIEDVCFELASLAQRIDAAPNDATRTDADRRGGSMYQKDWECFGAENAAYQPSCVGDQQNEI